MKLTQGEAARGGSSTMVIEMPSRSHSRAENLKEQLLHPTEDTSAGALPAPTTAVPVLQKWNAPRINLYRVLATFYSFTILGADAAAYGALIPYLETWYQVNYTVISLVFLSPIVGYTASALSNNKIHVTYGQRGVALIMSLSHLISYIIISVHPPYPVLIIVFVLTGFGNGLGDSAWNAWVGDMANQNEVLGFLHAFFGLGAAVAPLVATTVITKAGWKWFEFYYVMTGAAVLEVISLVWAFWGADAKEYNALHPKEVDIATSGSNTPTGVIPARRPAKPKSFLAKVNLMNKNSMTAEAVKNKVTILTSLFLLIYVGVEVSIGGWMVTFMLRVRHGSAFASGLTSTGFWLGITVGRLILGFVTARCFKTEKHAVATYLIVCIVLQLLFWLIPQFVVSAVMIGLLGFFLGPLFPAAVVALTKLLPKRMHVAAVGFAGAFGASGACVLPFMTGAIANAVGVRVLQPIILVGIVGCLVMWLLIPKLPKQRQA